MYSSRSTRGRSTILALALLVPLLARVDGQCSGSCTFFCWDPGDCYSGQCSCRSSGGGSSRPPPPPPPRPSPTPPPAPTRPPRNDPELDEIESTLGFTCITPELSDVWGFSGSSSENRFALGAYDCGERAELLTDAADVQVRCDHSDDEDDEEVWQARTGGIDSMAVDAPCELNIATLNMKAGTSFSCGPLNEDGTVAFISGCTLDNTVALGAYVEGQDYTVFYIAALVLIALIELCGLGYIAMEEKVGWRSFTIILQVGLRSFDMFSDWAFFSISLRRGGQFYQAYVNQFIADNADDYDASDRKALLEGAVAHFDHVYYSSMAFSIIGTLLWFPDVWSYIYVRITAEGDEKLESLRVAALVSVLVFIAEDFPQTVINGIYLDVIGFEKADNVALLSFFLGIISLLTNAYYAVSDVKKVIRQDAEEKPFSYTNRVALLAALLASMMGLAGTMSARMIVFEDTLPTGEAYQHYDGTFELGFAFGGVSVYEKHDCDHYESRGSRRRRESTLEDERISMDGSMDTINSSLPKSTPLFGPASPRDRRQNGLSVVSGSSYCSIDSNGCATDGYGNHGDNEACTIRVGVAGTLTATQFETESGYDYVTIGETQYQGRTGPSSVAVAAGSTFSWRSDGSGTYSGWTICLASSVPPPPPPPPAGSASQVPPGSDVDGAVADCIHMCEVEKGFGVIGCVFSLLSFLSMMCFKRATRVFLEYEGDSRGCRFVLAFALCPMIATMSYIIVWSTALEKFNADPSHNVDGSLYFSPNGDPVPGACGYGGADNDKLSKGEGFAFFVMASVFQLLSIVLAVWGVRTDKDYYGTEA